MARQGKTDLSDYYFSSYNYYARGKKDGIITPDPRYLALSDDPKECMRLYKEYVMQKRPYEMMVDKGLKI